MTHLKRFTAYFFILVMALSLTACNRQSKQEITDQEKLVGTWYIEIDREEVLYPMLEETLREKYSMEWRPEFDELMESCNPQPLKYTQYIRFNENMTVDLYVDNDAVLKSLEPYQEEAARLHSEIKYALFADEGYNREEADRLSIERYGMTIYEKVKAEYVEESESVISSIARTRWYYVRDNKIILTNADDTSGTTYFEFLDDNTLKLQGESTFEYKRVVE